MSNSPERAILVHAYFNQQFVSEELEEFSALAHAAGVQVLESIIANVREPHAKYLIGSGKAEEVQQAVQAHAADLVIINQAITPAQERNLSRLWNCRVVDRTGLILDIFAQRARTYEGKLQVELAQLNHLASRLVRGWTHLERQKGGIGLRGPGESQLETDRRLIRQRIKYLNARLQDVRKQREQSRRARQRSETVTISLVGYTNAGKSTLFNKFTGSEVFVANQLFATLDPTVRRIEIPGMGAVVLVDTVGFIQQLPHDLVEAFRSTLEETRTAHLLLHVVDANDPQANDKQVAVHEVLQQIDADDVPQLLVYNKIDKLNIEPRIDRDEQGIPYRVWVSAVTQEGMDLLQNAISERLNQAYTSVTLHLPSNAGRIHAQLHAYHGVVSEKTTEEGEWLVTVNLPHAVLERIFKENGLQWQEYLG
ncbi:MAG: ribosome rescue GTPase HflX [Gammaproteobacteria bacterium]